MQSRKVLVADEEASSRELLRILLENEGCEVSEAGDGLRAIAVARATRPDLVLMDLDLPDVDGYAAAREMRRGGRLNGRCIVAMTEDWQNTDHDRLREAGFTGYMAKPVDRRALHQQLEKFLPA